MKLFTLILFIILSASGCRKDRIDEAVPIVSTGPMFRVEITSAIAQANILNYGGSALTASGFCWNTLPQPTINDYKSIENVTPGLDVISSLINDLKPGTVYYLRAYATNKAGTGYGNEISFTTKPAEMPWVHTGEISDITKTSAVCEGIFQYDGGAKIISLGICYSLFPEPTVKDFSAEATGYRYSVKISDLLPNTHYYVRAFATNSVGTGYGLTKSFRTKAFFEFSVSVTEITRNSARCTAKLITDAEKPVLEWGICWAASPNPGVNDNKMNASAGENELTTEFTDLSSSVTYYLRPFIITSSGIEYGNETHFTTISSGETVTDIDGNIYNIVKIGNQTWMADNLRVTKFRDGFPISELWAYNNDNANVATYGWLYTFNVAQSGTVCPTGWHVPSNAEWSVLGSYLVMNGHNYDGSIPLSNPFSGPSTYNNNKLGKSLASASGWNTSNVNGAAGSPDFPEKRNSSGFNAKPGGIYLVNDKFYFLGSKGMWWSSDMLRYTCSYAHGSPVECFMSSWDVTYDIVSFGAGVPYFGTRTAYSIRCLKD